MNVLFEVGRMLQRNQRVEVCPDEAKRKFDLYVRTVSAGFAAQELNVEEVYALGDHNRRREDRLPSDVAEALGLDKKATYADAILEALTEMRHAGAGVIR